MRLANPIEFNMHPTCTLGQFQIVVNGKIKYDSVFKNS